MGSGFGYGSHPFLNKCIRQNRCKRIMEIGVADGENAREMVMVASEIFPAEEVEYYGFDIFRWNDYSKVRRQFEKTCCQIKFFRGDSVKTLPKVVKELPMMDLIFIDGGHSYSTVKTDWENSKSLMHDKTTVFFHNYDFSGPKRVVGNISREEYHVEIIDPPSDCMTALVRKKIDK